MNEERREARERLGIFDRIVNAGPSSWGKAIAILAVGAFLLFLAL